jgi:hypothetical protein
VHYACQHVRFIFSRSEMLKHFISGLVERAQSVGASDSKF